MKTSFYNKIEEIKKNTIKKSNQISKLNPPRKNLSSINKNQETTGIKHNSKSGNEISSLYETDLNNNFEKDSGFEDIFDDIGNMGFKMNNYTQYGKDIKKDNYIYLEKIKLFGKLKKSLLPLDESESFLNLLFGVEKKNKDNEQTNTSIIENEKEIEDFEKIIGTIHDTEVKKKRVVDLLIGGHEKNKNKKIFRYFCESL